MRAIPRLLLLSAASLLAACHSAPPPPPPAASAPPPPAASGTIVAPSQTAALPAYSRSSVAPTVAPGSAVRLSANDSLALLSNNTAIGLTDTGHPYVVYFAGDGDARFRESGDSDSGTWRVLADGEVCSRLPRISPNETCYILSRYGDVILYQSPDGLALGSVRILSGNPQVL